jgi:chorismate-pyruvate lyase
MTPRAGAIARVERLVALFSPLDAFGAVREVDSADVPQPHRGLLDHLSHMTVAMERFHGGPVSLQVVATRSASAKDRGYAREILLLDQRGRRVQYGIVRIDLDVVPQAVANRIRAADTPLGRVLLDAGCLCDVQHVELLDILIGPHLAALIGPGRTFGRVATIAVGGRPAVELLEVVAGCDVPLDPCS